MGSKKRGFWCDFLRKMTQNSLTNGSKTLTNFFSKLRLNEIEPVFLRKSQFFPHKFPHKFEKPSQIFSCQNYKTGFK